MNMMQKVSLLLTLLFHRLTAADQSKFKLRMDIVVAVSYTSGANEKRLQDALILILHTFDFNRNYTRMTLLDYEQDVWYRASFVDDYDKLEFVIRSARIKETDHRSSLHLALAEMLKAVKHKGRSDTIKVFLVITHELPTKTDGKQYDYEDGLPFAKELNKTGLLFIVYDHRDEIDPKGVDYFKRLCGEQNLLLVKHLNDIEKEMREKIFSKIFALACDHPQRFCRFLDLSLERCQGIWHFPDGYFDDEECRIRRKGPDPISCRVSECHEHCDHYWPWELESESCDCNQGLGRIGNISWPNLLTYCPKAKACSRCGVDEIATDSVDNDADDEVSPALNLIAAALIFFAVVITMGVIAYGAFRCSKRFGFFSPNQTTTKSKFADRSTKKKSQSQSSFRSGISSKVHS